MECCNTERCDSHSSVLIQRANALFKEKKMVDINIKINGESIEAHRLVLVAYSVYFESCLSSHTMEPCVVLDNLSLDASSVWKLIQFMYSGNLDLKNCDLKNMLHAANVLQVTEALNILQLSMQSGDCGQKATTEPNLRETINEESFSSVYVKTHTIKGCPPSDANEGAVTPSDTMQEFGMESLTEYAEGATRMNVGPCGSVVVSGVHSGSPESVKDGNVKAGTPVRQLCCSKRTRSSARKLLEIDSCVSDLEKLSHKGSKESRTEDQSQIEGTNEKNSSPVIMETRGKNSRKDLLENKKRKVKIDSVKHVKQTRASKVKNTVTPIAHLKSQDGIYKCPNCAYSSKKPKNFRLHWRRHTGERPYVCPTCGKAFVDQKYLKYHVRIHTGEKPYKCSHCESAFTGRVNLKRHIKAVHDKQRPYKCDHSDCHYAAADPSTLRKHRETHIPKEEKESTHMCDVCGKCYTGRRSLHQHLLSHSDTDLHCVFCDHRTKYKNQLISHMMRVHSVDLDGNPVERQYKCHLCSFASFTQYEYNFHLQKHSGDKPHRCPVCGFATVDKGTLKKHLRTHTGETPFPCKICGKPFTQQSGLARHMRTHLGVKPYKCEICNKEYADKKSLDTHKYKHANLKPFMCHFCPYACVRKDVLLNHINKIHGEIGANSKDVKKTALEMSSDSSTTIGVSDAIETLAQNVNEILQSSGNGIELGLDQNDPATSNTANYSQVLPIVFYVNTTN